MLFNLSQITKLIQGQCIEVFIYTYFTNLAATIGYRIVNEIFYEHLYNDFNQEDHQSNKRLFMYPKQIF